MSDDIPDFRPGLLYEQAYESALGRMLVRFNMLEVSVGQVLEGAMSKLGVPHLYRVDDYYRQKVDRLELALCALPTWPKPDFDRLRRINGWRNEIAHGHFAQDPNTAAYRTTPVHKRGAKDAGITPEMIDEYTRAAIDAWAEVGMLMAYVWFDDPPAGAMRMPESENGAGA